ncbi:MAG: VWA domain-containing protein [Methylacidiphilales bacterium]|nr:VWA domain-containing protein [Candidatus Methylacidiphilales bacterium]
MRPGITLMLGVSFALHAGLAAGVAIFDFHVHLASAPASTPQKTTNLVLIPSNQVPARWQLAPIQQALPVLAQSLDQRYKPGTTTPAVIAFAASPNGEVRALSPESVLCPSPAPQLNPACGVVFLLDVSGSMYEPYAGATRLAFAREALTRRIRALVDGTPFAITVYGESAQNSGPLVPANNATREAAIEYINEEFDCGGGTNLPAGFASAQALHPGRLVLATDGDLNISLTDLLGDTAQILGADGQQPALSVVGISPRANTDAERQLHALADQEGGSYIEEAPADGNAALMTSAQAVMTIP